MEISLLKVLSDAISTFLHLSFSEKMKLEPVSKCFQKAEKMLKLLKPIVETTVFSDIASNEGLRKLFEELGLAVDELRELILNWHPLSSKFYFVSFIMSLYYNQGFSLHPLFHPIFSSQNYHIIYYVFLSRSLYLFNLGFPSGIEVYYVLVVFSDLLITDVICLNYCLLSMCWLSCFPLF